MFTRILKYQLPFLLIIAGFFTLAMNNGCEKKYDFSTLPKDERISLNETTYVEITPAISGFTKISSVIVGGDQLIYVADYEANTIYQLDISGKLLGAFSISHPSALAQDSRLDLLVCAETASVAAIYRLPLSKFGLRLSNVPQTAAKRIWIESRNPQRRFSGIAILAENQYIVSRVGTNNTNPIDPDSRILWFKKNDTLETYVTDLQTGTGSGITYLYKPTGILSFARRKDFIVTQTSEGVNYGALWMIHYSSSDFTGWLPYFNPANPSQRTDFVRPDQFTNATGGAVDQSSSEVFILNAGANSNSYAVFKFDRRGRFKKESIRPNMVSPPLLNPSSAAFADKVLYVAQETRIFRFKLSTDFLR